VTNVWQVVLAQRVQWECESRQTLMLGPLVTMRVSMSEEKDFAEMRDTFTMSNGLGG
jgi:hypothetical protein